MTPLRAVEAEISELFGVLDGLRDQFRELAGPVLRRDHLAALRPAILGALSAHPDLAAGTGVITAPGVLADAPLWLEWWWMPPAGQPERLRVNLDPAAPDFYDYTTAPWYTMDSPRIVGPYVDHFCTGQYTITLSVPVFAGQRFLGVAAADVPVSSLERRVLPALLDLGRPVALTSADGRIIASTSADWPPGVLSPAPGPAGDRPVGGPAGGEAARRPIGQGGWQLAELPEDLYRTRRAHPLRGRWAVAHTRACTTAL